MVYLIQKKEKKNLYQHIIITQSLLLTFGFLLLLSHNVVPDSLQPHGLKHTRLPCPSLSPEVCSNSHSMGVDKCIMTCISKYHDLWYHTVYFHCPKNPLCSTYSSVPPQPLAVTDLFTV